MTTVKRETRDYTYLELGKEKHVKVTYDLVFREGKLETVFNTAHGNWGHSVERASEVFTFFNEKYNR